MLTSSVVYILFSLLMGVLGFISSNCTFRRRRIEFCPEIMFLILLFCFFCGVRYNVGVDYLAYLNNYIYFQNVGMDFLDKEPLFEFITRVMAGNGLHFSLYFAFLAFLQIYFVIKSFEKEKEILRYLPLLIILGTSFLYWMNAIRHMIAASIFLYSLRYVKSKSLFSYLICISVAFLFHKSSIILLPFYFILRVDFFRYRKWTFLAIFLSFVLQKSGVVDPLIQKLSFVLDFLGYSYSYENFDLIMAKTNERTFGIRSIIIMTIPLVVVLYNNHLRTYFSNTNYSYYYNLMVIGLIGSIIIIDLPVSFGRVVDFFVFFTVFCSSYLLLYFDIKRDHLMLFTYLLLTCSYLPLSLYVLDYNLINESTSFKFFWDYI